MFSLEWTLISISERTVLFEKSYGIFDAKNLYYWLQNKYQELGSGLSRQT